MDVSVIIVNYNTCKMTCECIDSIVEKTKDVEYEIILVDNASTDGSKEFFEKDSRIKYIYSERNGGFGYGNNLGMKVAKGKYFFLLNSDTLLINNAIKEFFDYAEKDEKKRVYGCYLQHQDGTYSTSFFLFPAFTICDFLLRKFHLKKCPQIDFSYQEVEAVSGTDMFFCRSIYDKIGGFDENIFMYGEEGEWQYRMRKEGYSGYLIASPQVIHHGGKTTNRSPNIKKKKIQSHFYILKKHMLYPTYILARFFYAIVNGLKMLNCRK